MNPNAQEVKVKEILSFGSGVYPSVLLNFQNGELSSIKKEDTVYFQVKSTKPEPVNGAVVITASNVYYGNINNTNNELTDTYICVRNKTTGKARIMPVAQSLLSNIIHNADKTIEPQRSREESLAVFANKFADRKISRALTQSQSMKVNVSVVKDDLEKIVNESILDDTITPDNLGADYIKEICPPYNEEATALSDIYNLEEIISEKVFKKLNKDVKLVYSSDIADIPLKSEYLLNKIADLKKEDSKTKDAENKIKILMYMDGLRNLIRSSAKHIKKHTEFSIIECVNENIKIRFGDSNGRMTSRSFDKAICYYLVLSYFISDKYQINIPDVLQDLSLNKKKVFQIAQIINGKTSSGNNLTLQLPSKMKRMEPKKLKRLKRQSLLFNKL